MEFNINTASNDELIKETKKIEENFNSTQNEIKELLKRMRLFSDAYEKIQDTLKKRGIQLNEKKTGKEK